jgi:acyl-CoA synthetase (AMP-forming)/AMP-acid ligase II
VRLIDYFHKGMERDPDRAAFVDDDLTLTFRQADGYTARVAAGLHSLGLADGVKIAVLSPNDAMAFVCVLGAIRAGGIWLPINMRNPAEANAAFLNLTGCEVLFFHSSLEDDAKKIQSRVPTLRMNICIDGSNVTGKLSFDELISIVDIPTPEVADDPDRVVIVFATGGTTGLSKAAVWTQRVWEATTSALWTSCPASGPPVHLVAAPMTHGAGVVAMGMLPGGATNVILRRADPVAIMEAIQRHRVTHMYLPPTLIYMLLAHPDVLKYDFSSLQYLIIAAAPIAPEKLREALKVFNSAVCQSFGQAEAPMLLTFLASRDLITADRSRGPDRFASCGRATLNTRVEIMDDEGRLLPPREKGEIVARSDLVFAGYYNNPEATADVSRFGWHHTGDVGYKDEEGFVYIVDRKKDMIITGGFNVYSAEIEQVILSHQAVQDCVVIGVPDDKWGEAVKAILQLKPDHSVTENEIRDLVRTQLGGVQAPKTVEIWTDLPRSANGKVLKTEVRREFWADRERAV